MNKSILKALPKVFIGFIAAGSAAVVPRLVAHLSVQNTSAVTLFSGEFLTVAGVFALFIGIIVAIVEYGAKRSPRDTFMTALGIPALLAGALTTTDGVNRISEQQKEIQALGRQAGELAGIPRAETMLNFTPLGPRASRELPASDRVMHAMLGIGVADAAEVAAQSATQRLGYSVRESYYMVVLHQAPSAKDAEKRAITLRQRRVDARVMQAGDNFFVTLGGPLPESEAVQQAIRIKQRKLPGVDVSLVRTSQ